MRNRNVQITVCFLCVGVGIVALVAWGQRPAQDLPEVTLGAPGALCGVNPELPAIMREIRQAIRDHRLRTTGDAEVPVPEGDVNVDIGNVAVLEDRGDLMNAVMFVGGGPPSFGFVTDTTEIAQRFYTTHDDLYHFIVIFVASTFGDPDVVVPEAGFAFARMVKNKVNGIGLDIFDDSGVLDLPTTKCRTIVNMNDLGEYPLGPDTIITGDNFNHTGLEILGQEVGHRWGAFVNVNTDVADILGRGNAHWSFFLNTADIPGTEPPGASVMEGNSWIDNGNDTFTTGEPFDSYSELDEYLMGLRSKDGDANDTGVSPMFFVDTGGGGESARPEEGVTVGGTKTTVTIDDVITANGSRVVVTESEFEVSFSNLAFILVVPEGVPASAADLAKVNAFRSDFEKFYAAETGKLGIVTTTLSPACNNNETCEGSENCATCAACACAPSEVCDAGMCTTCFNNTIEGIEVCDGADLDGATCMSLGFCGGALACNTTCDGFDTSSCTVDPACSTDGDCDDADACTTDTCSNPGTCTAACSNAPITLCGNGDGCCPADCTPANDNDCTDCGNGTCDSGEDCNTCPNDCGSKINGNPNSRYCCDGNLPDCGDPRCNEDGFLCGPPCTDDSDCNPSELCCSGVCMMPECSDDAACDDANACTTDTCLSGGTCAASCDYVCDQCEAKGDPCMTGADCCSGICKRNGTCR